MPSFFIDTPDILPLPSLQSYAAISVLLLSCSIYYAFQVTSEPDWKLNATLSVGLSVAQQQQAAQQTAEAQNGGILLDLANQNPAVATVLQDLVNDTIANLTDLASGSAATSQQQQGNGGSPSSVAMVGLLSALANQANETSINFGLLLENPIIVRLIDVTYLMFHEPLCIWTVINMAYCCLILFGRLIQGIVFGDLRVSEQQHLKDRFWNFVFYKFIFIFGVMNVQYVDEVILWCSWFSILGFLTLLAQLSRDRFEYLSFSPMTPKWTHARLVGLLFGILGSSLFLLAICGLVGLHAGINTFAFMAAECVLVGVRTFYVMVRYSIHLWDLNHEGVWENRASFAYYTELLFELAVLFIDFLHHLHMLIWGNVILSIASLVILMQLRFLFYEMKRRIRKHNNYLQVVRLMEANFPMATHEELERNSDDCAICWDRMDFARKLPCGHLFHNSCLRSWLEQDTSCPTCRTSLKNRAEEDMMDVMGQGMEDPNAPAGQGARGPNGGAQGGAAGGANGRTNHFFHFDGSRYASWLPSVSVEVTRPHLINFGVIHNTLAESAGLGPDSITPTSSSTPTPTSSTPNLLSAAASSNSFSVNQSPGSSLAGQHQLEDGTEEFETMADQIHEWFPHIPLGAIREDLRGTLSADATTENILDGRIRLSAPPQSRQSLDAQVDSQGGQASSSSTTQRTFPFSSTLSSASSTSSSPTKTSISSKDELECKPQTISQHATKSSLDSDCVTCLPAVTDQQKPAQKVGSSLPNLDKPSSPETQASQNDACCLSGSCATSSGATVGPSQATTVQEVLPAPSATSFSGRFSKSSSERQRMLLRRKEDLLQLARRSFMGRLPSFGSSSTSSSSTAGMPASASNNNPGKSPNKSSIGSCWSGTTTSSSVSASPPKSSYMATGGTTTTNANKAPPTTSSTTSSSSTSTSRLGRINRSPSTVSTISSSSSSSTTSSCMSLEDEILFSTSENQSSSNNKKLN